MSRILSFSAERSFAEELPRLMRDAGYSNRSMFLRDASIHFAEAKRRGDLAAMQDEEVLSGTIVIYYQHGVEDKLLSLRHSHDFHVSSYSHTCLAESHSCVDTMHVSGKAGSLRAALNLLSNTHDIDRVNFLAAPMRTDGCC